MNALISGVLPLLAAESQAIPLIVLLVMAILQFFAALIFFPETSGVSLEDMQRRMGAHHAENGEGRLSKNCMTPHLFAMSRILVVNNLAHNIQRACLRRRTCHRNNHWRVGLQYAANH